MLRLLIVDDEPVIANAMYDIISDINEYDLDIYLAYSGEEAINWMKRTKIDIVLTDISMPGLSGLDIQKIVLEMWPRCKVIFLSGHNDFEYIQSAIRNEGFDYILKTEPEEVVLAAIKKAANDIENEMKAEQLLERAKKSMTLALPVLQSKCMLDIVEGIVFQQTDIRNLFNEYQIPLSTELPVILLTAKIDKWPENLDGVKKMQIIYGIQAAAIEQLVKFAVVIPVIHDRSSIVWFIQPLQEGDNPKFLPEDSTWKKLTLSVHGSMDNIQMYCNRLYNVPVSFAAGKQPTDWGKVASKYESMKLSIEKASGITHETLLIESDCLEEDCDQAMVYEEYTMRSQLNRIDTLKAHLEKGEEEEFFLLFTHLMDIGLKSKLHSFDISVEIYYLLSAMFLSYLNRWKLTELLGYNINLEKLKNMNEFKKWEEVVSYFSQLAKSLFEYRMDESLRNANRIFGFIKNYVQQNLAGDLSLTKFAEMLHFHPFYLSRLFKQVTGKTLTDYISDEKMKKAKELLESSNLKVNEIAATLGFDTASYFTRFFKKRSEVTPQEYRNALP